MLTHTGPPLIAASLHRLILGGLLPPAEPASASPDHCLIHDQMKRTQSRVGQGRPNVSHRRGQQRGSCGRNGDRGATFPVSVSLRPHREREAELLMVTLEAQGTQRRSAGAAPFASTPQERQKTGVMGYGDYLIKKHPLWDS